jgi:surface antigen
MKVHKLIPAVTAVALLAGCASSGGTKETVGTVGGAVVGGVIGSQFGGGTGRLVATGVGTLLGAFIGKEIGASLDKADQAHAENAARRAYAAPIGDPVSWSNPQSGNSGVITTTRDGWSSSGNYCREFKQQITIGGRSEAAFGTACKQSDGSWKIVG